MIDYNEDKAPLKINSHYDYYCLIIKTKTGDVFQTYKYDTYPSNKRLEEDLKTIDLKIDEWKLIRVRISIKELIEKEWFSNDSI